MFNPFEVSQRNFQLSVENNRFALVLSFALLCSVIGPEKSRHSINQLNSKLTPIMTWSPAFSRAPWAVCVILVWISIGSSRYLIFFRVAVVFGFGFGFTTIINRRALYLQLSPQADYTMCSWL